jgi:hypothetical protein
MYSDRSCFSAPIRLVFLLLFLTTESVAGVILSPVAQRAVEYAQSAIVEANYVPVFLPASNPVTGSATANQTYAGYINASGGSYV